MNETAVDCLVAHGFPLALRTGLHGIDDVLQNVLQYGEVSEIIGDCNVGKTQFCYALVANMLLEMEFGVVWIDSNGSFRSIRLIEYLQRRKETTTDRDKMMILLDRLQVIRSTNHIQLLEALEYIEEHMDDDNIRFIVIDNADEMIFDDQLLVENSERSAVVNLIVGQINALTDIGLTIVTTTTSSYSQNEEKTEPKVWKQHMKGQILIEQEGDGDVRIVRSLDAANDVSSSRQCRFRITDTGLQDVN